MPGDILKRQEISSAHIDPPLPFITMFANANYERVGAAQPLAGAYQALSDSRSATPSPPASQTNHHAYRQPSANPFGSPTPSIMSRRSSIDSYAHLAPNRPEDGEDSVYSGRGGKDAEVGLPRTASTDALVGATVLWTRGRR